MVTTGMIKAEYEGTPYDMRPREILIDAIGLGCRKPINAKAETVARLPMFSAAYAGCSLLLN
jgi:hypothetical protein